MNLEMSGTMNFVCIFALLRGPRVILALLPLWQLWAIIFICIKPKWPPNCETETQLLNYLPQNILQCIIFSSLEGVESISGVNFLI